MKKMLGCHADERGFVLIAALLILVLLTIIGIAAISTSTSERQTATNFLLYERAFYSAEAGLEHAKADLLKLVAAQPILSGAAYSGPTFTFALNGTTKHPNGNSRKKAVTSTDEKTKNSSREVPWLSNLEFDGHTYTITVWDNDDDMGTQKADEDSDGMIWIRSEVVGPGTRNSKCSIEALVQVTSTGSLVSNDLANYAQGGGGSEKNYTANDVGKVDLTNNNAGKKTLNTGG
jgi:Tfp pilus assembly protein PilX